MFPKPASMQCAAAAAMHIPSFQRASSASHVPALGEIIPQSSGHSTSSIPGANALLLQEPVAAQLMGNVFHQVSVAPQVQILPPAAHLIRQSNVQTLAECGQKVDTTLESESKSISENEASAVADEEDEGYYTVFQKMEFYKQSALSVNEGGVISEECRIGIRELKKLAIDNYIYEVQDIAKNTLNDIALECVSSEIFTLAMDSLFQIAQSSMKILKGGPGGEPPKDAWDVSTPDTWDMLHKMVLNKNLSLAKRSAAVDSLSQLGIIMHDSQMRQHAVELLENIIPEIQADMDRVG